MQTKKPDVANIDNFIGKAPLGPNASEDQTNPSAAPASSAQEESLKEKAPRTTKTTKPRKDSAEVKEDPLVHLNVPIPLSLRDWLNIKAIQKRTNLSKMLVEILEKYRAESEE